MEWQTLNYSRFEEHPSWRRKGATRWKERGFRPDDVYWELRMFGTASWR